MTINPDALDTASLPTFEFSFPGPLRETLIAAVLDGSKTSTTGLLAGYEHENLPLGKVGDRSVVIDSEDRPVAIIEITSVRVVPLAEVDLSHVIDEGEGHATVPEWRATHEDGWHSEEQRAEFGDPTFTVNDTTLVVLQRFSLVADLRPSH
jgi:uncharacterized protein YhfF